MTDNSGDYPNGNRSGPEEGTNGDISFESIVAAMLGNKTVLSPEDLEAFDALLDASDINPEQRRELLQTLWALVVSITDLAWAGSVDLTASKACGQVTESPAGSQNSAQSVLNCKEHLLSEKHNKAATAPPTGAKP